jgi:lysophospholipase L1-like esterase
MRRLLPLLAIPFVACGGEGGSPVQPSPSPAGPTGTVQVTVFYDENANGQLDGNEMVRIPNVTVALGSASSKTQQGTGMALVQGIPYGTQTVTVETNTLPPYWIVKSAATLSIPEQREARIAVTLPVHEAMVPNQYLAFGDSLTRGEGSSTGEGYPPILEAALRSAMGAAWVTSKGADGTSSSDGRKRLLKHIDFVKPTHTLILYGTNDWNSPQCQSAPAAACYTIDELRSMTDTVRSRGGLTIHSTLPPVSINTGRNLWIEQMNGLIKALGHEQGVAVVDAYAAFRSAGNLSSLYDNDDVHLNDAGYELLARVFATGLTTGRGTGSSMTAAHGLAFAFVEPARSWASPTGS